MKKRIRRTILILLTWVLLLSMLSGCFHEHDFGAWRTARKATCTRVGMKERKCDCGEIETEEIPLLDHKYHKKVTTEASCSQSGVITYTCRTCDNSYTENYDVSVYPSTEIYDMYLNSVGEIIVYDKKGNELGLGTCFVYSENGKLITNYHVIEGAHSADVTLGEETYTVESVVAYDKDIDIAILQIPASGLTPVHLCSNDHSVGETVYAFGNSRGLTSTFSDGMITSSRELDGVDYVQHDAPISAGNSGGPLINQYGEVIGINTWTVVDSQNLNFAIHVSELDHLSNNSPLTMEAFYEKECNPFRMIRDYTMAHSEEDDGLYLVTLYETTSSGGYYYSISSLYSADDNEIWLCMGVDAEYYVYFVLEEDVSGVYEWTYFDDYDNDMYGTLYATSFTSNSTLSYSYSNEYGSDRQATIDLSTAMMEYLCSHLDVALAEIGVTAHDLGFINF